MTDTITLYRNITALGIEQLKKQGCSSTDWSQIYTHPETDFSRIKNSHFSGKVTIGKIEGENTAFGGVKRHNGI